MKKLLLCAAILLLFFLPGCKKDSSSNYQPDNTAHVIVQIDYLGAGGYYNDDIAGVPSGLVVGSNGPYDIDGSQTYSIDYKPSSSWTTPAHLGGVIFTPGYTFVIHCYVKGNIAYVDKNFQ